MNLKLCVIPGDGVGREVIPCAVEALRRVAPDLETVDADAGWDCFTRAGNAFPDATRAAIETCGAALFGATSSPSRKVEGYRSPILQMRQAFDLFANLRPTRDVGLRIAGSGVGAELPPGVAPADLLIVRENTEGLYVQREYLRGDEAVAERVITRAASARTASRKTPSVSGRMLALCTIVRRLRRWRACSRAIRPIRAEAAWVMTRSATASSPLRYSRWT